MNREELEIIQNRIGYRFYNPDLLQQAFVRRSYAVENGGEDNEVLEFIGDKALDICIVKILVEKFGFYTSQCEGYEEEEDFDEFCCEFSEGDLTELKKQLVEKKMLAERIQKLGFADYLILGKGDVKNRVYEEASVKEDLFEAIIGAVSLDSDWNWEEIQNAVELMLDPDSYLAEEPVHYVDEIQEWCLKEYQQIPSFADGGFQNAFFDWSGKTVYSSLAEKMIHAPKSRGTLFFSHVRLGNFEKSFCGCGESKSQARRDACRGAFLYLEAHGLFLSIRDEIKEPSREDAIGQLETLSRRGYFSLPTYRFEKSHGKDGQPVWKSECRIPEWSVCYSAKSSTKKDAKKSAAFEMLSHVLSR